MPLNGSNFVYKGHLMSADIKGFYDLLTGSMTDQPVTVANTLTADTLATGFAPSVPTDADVQQPTDGMLRLDSSEDTLYFRSRGAWHATAAGGDNSVVVFEQQGVSGSTVTLPVAPPIGGVFEVAVNGQQLISGRDWSISGAVITFTTPLSNDDVYVSYVVAPASAPPLVVSPAQSWSSLAPPSASTTSTTWVDMPGDGIGNVMRVDMTTTGGDLLVWIHGVLRVNTTSPFMGLAISLDGAAEVAQVGMNAHAVNLYLSTALVHRFTGVPAGTHYIKGRWSTPSGTLSGNTQAPTAALVVCELHQP